MSFLTVLSTALSKVTPSASTVMAGGTFGLGTAASVIQGLAQYNQGQFAKEVAGRQAGALTIQAQQVQQQAGAQIAEQDYKAAHIISSMRAGTGASGITEEGSPATVEATSVDEARLNDMYAKYAANIQSTNLYYQGQIDVGEAQQEAQAATMGAIVTGTTGAISSGIDAWALHSRTNSYGLTPGNP